MFDAPWDHDAEGIELQWLLQNHPERGGGFYQDRWQIWKFKDALFRGDLVGAEDERISTRQYALDRLQRDSWWGPGSVFFRFVWLDLEVRQIEWAGDDLIFWIGVSSTEDVENDNTNRTNSRQVIDIVGRFIAAGGSAHPRFEEINDGCLKIGEDSYQVLSQDLREIIQRLANT